MTNFSFAPPNLGVGDNKKNYVFVDEHNRHKRLKVMRACEGCRHRKIKCDAATTNSWPCGACLRLKVTCVPPTVNYNQAHVGLPPSTSGLERVLDFGDSSGDSADESFTPRPAKRLVFKRPDPLSTTASYAPGIAAFTPTTATAPISYKSVATPTLPANNAQYYAQTGFHGPISVSQPAPAPKTGESWPREEFSVGDLQNIMGSLKVNDNGTAPYIVLQKKTLAEAPALEEAEVFPLPNVAPDSDARVRIPPDLMPDDERAMEYLDIFFSSVHPYVPVISKPYFYRQWRTGRHLISPLLLEAIFAAAGRYSNDPAQGLQWLAMASKHESCFMDVPRLSTIQALLILLKAREANPKRGYYYRSWMTLKTACTMAKDLELDEHYAAHQDGRICADLTECHVKTRIWQTIFCGEILIGGPQGRRDMSVSSSTVDFSIPTSLPGGDDDETRSWRRYVYLARGCRNVRLLFEIYAMVKQEGKDWQFHPRIQALNPSFPDWLAELPPEMQILFPADGSPPWLESHVIGNVHCYYHLGILLLHRPQLMASSFTTSSSWKEHMSVSYESAKAICRIQESLLRDFGIHGLMFMQRGINFAIYCILSCVMLHLAAITIPDPEYNTDAKEYFTRHMRILESCIAVNPMDDMQAQIESLREAFSANIHKPFELKPSFPHGSPIAPFAPSPPADASHFDPVVPPSAGMEQSGQFSFNQLTPPISAGLEDVKEEPLAATKVPMMPDAGQTVFSGGHMDDEPVPWDPTRLFHQWHTAFGTPTSTGSAPGTAVPMTNPQSPTIYSSSASTVSHDMPGAPEALPSAQYIPSSIPSANQNVTASAAYPASMGQSLITSQMWQDTVASTYVPRDLKRRWDGVGGPSWNEQQQVKRLY